MQTRTEVGASPAEPGNPAQPGAQHAAGVRSAGGVGLRKQANAGTRK